MWESFLKETRYCDYSHPLIQKICRRFKKRYLNQKDLAVALFYYVRDNVLYQVGDWNYKASETLIRKSGTCTNKSNLLVALLRAVGIPAGYGVMRVNAREYFGPAMIKMFKNKVGKKSLHLYCFVYLNNRWIKCDPSDDRKLSNHTSYFNLPSKLVEWDGQRDAMLYLNPEHILEDRSLTDDIDDIISKKPRHAKGIILKIANLYIKFLRQNNKKISNQDELEILFKQWLKNNNKLWHFLYSLSSALGI